MEKTIAAFLNKGRGTMLNKTMKLTVVSSVLALMLCSCRSMAAGQKYQPTKASLENCEVPEWYQDAKFGIWPIWGVYSVPAHRGDHAGEWYGIWMHCVEKEPETIKLSPKKRWNDYYDLLALNTAAHHRRTFGDPGKFGYHDFFPMWKAEKWDPDAWARLTVDAGAKFLCMMGTFHDGISLYDSDHTRWDTVDMGPKRDLCADMKKALHARGLRFGISNHFAWNSSFFKYYHNNGYAKGQDEYSDLYSEGVVDQAYMKRWWDRTTEMVDKCKPDLYYFDWGWHETPWVEGRYHEKFAAYFYNRAIQWGRGSYGKPGVVLNSKFGPMTRYSVRDLERGKMSKTQSRVWQTDTSISVHSWGYSTEDEYYSPDHLIDSLVDIVSKNGILMLAFGPRADGTVPDEYARRLLAMGKWLKVNGEAIYGTRPYYTFGEGPAPKGGHEKQASEPYDGVSVRYTRNKDNDVLYATLLGWPKGGITVKALTYGNIKADAITSVRLLGNDRELEWKLAEEGLKIGLPNKPPCDHAYPIRIRVKGQLPSGLYSTSKGVSVRKSFAGYSLALGADVDSPDEAAVQSGKLPEYAVDGNPDTYWDDEDHKPVYRLRVTLEQPASFNVLVLSGYEHHNFSPRDFVIVCDGREIGRVKNAQYTNNQLILSVPETTCKTIMLVINGCYGGSPAIRELELHHLGTEK